jgi:hypothetical protein
MRLARIAAAAFAALLLAVPASAEEHILSFTSDVMVKDDGALEVAETIQILTEGDRIQRGIFRDFPIRNPDRNGGHPSVGFEVMSVERDGTSEAWVAEPQGNFVRVRMGRADVPLPAGEHVYILRYRTTRQLGYFRNYDELYWNVTGTGWPFAIDVAEARVTLPSSARFGKRAVYTGHNGSIESDAAVVSEEPGKIVFRTTRRLEPEEGLTIAVAWPKGIVTLPRARSSAKD